jgi:hypothetical protein
MEIVIVPAIEADGEAISALNRDVQGVHATALPRLFKLPGPESFPPSAQRALLAKPENIVLLARLGSEPAGNAYAEIIRRPETSLRYAHAMIYLHHVSVAAACRRQRRLTVLANASGRNGLRNARQRLWWSLLSS